MRNLPSLATLSMAALTAACSGKGSTPAGPPSVETATFASSLGVDLAASTKLPNGVYYRDLTVGTGAELTNGMQATVKYTGWFIDGKQFETNTDAGGVPFAFVVGRKGVIDGWDTGVVGMRAGGKRMLIIPPDKGYGGADYGKIPGNSVLVFTVELLDAR